MKILITTDWYRPVINGVVTSVINLAEGLEKEGHEVRILTLSDTVSCRKENNVYYFGSLAAGAIYPNARIILPMRHAFIEELVRWKPDIIHSQCEFSTFHAARKISARTGAPIVHTYHTVYEGYTHYFFPNRRVGRKLARAFSKLIAHRSEAFIVPSAKISHMMNDYKISTPVFVIPSGICLEQFQRRNKTARERIRRSLGISGEECLLLYIGRLAKEKNIEELISYLSDPQTPHCRLLIVGDGPDREDLLNTVRKAGMGDRVLFTGMVPPEKVADYYHAGDIFVNASTSETQGLTYMEAMASGLPLLCRRDLCLDGVIEQGLNGYTYDDRAGFQSHLTEMINDLQKRIELGRAARKTAIEKYSIPAFAEACEKVYERCAS